MFKLSKNYLLEKARKLKPYTSKQEKEVLLADDLTPHEALAMLSPVTAMNEYEAMYLLMKLREQSVSDVAEGMIDCTTCSAMNEFQLDILPKTDLDGSIPIGIFEKLSDFIEDDDLSILECNRLQKIMKSNNEKLLNLAREITCRVPSCNAKITVNLNPLQILSKSSLGSIYQEYYQFGKFLHYSNRDVDVLLPFERSLLFSLMKKDVETPKPNPFG